MGTCTSCNSNNNNKTKHHNIIKNPHNPTIVSNHLTNNSHEQHQKVITMQKEIQVNNNKIDEKINQVDISLTENQPTVIVEHVMTPNSIYDLLNTQSKNEDNNNNLIKTLPIYHMSKYYIRGCNDFSNESDYNSILKKAKTFSKPVLSLKLISLKERNWIRELMENSEYLKVNRINLNKPTLIKLMNQRTKLTEHFNSISWAIGIFYQSLLFSDHSTERYSIFKHEDCTLPSVDSLDWLNGFEWKGMYIRIQQDSESRDLYEELASLKLLYIEYLQMIELYNNSILPEETINKLLSNDLVFPLISVVKIYSVTLVVTAVIYSINAEESCLFGFYDKNNTINNKSDSNILDKNDMINDSKAYIHFHEESKINKAHNEKKLNNSKIDFSEFSLDNTYKQINLSTAIIGSYSYNDLSGSYLFKNLTNSNLLRISDGSLEKKENNEEDYKLKTKLVLINAAMLIPDLINKTKQKEIEMIIPDNDSKSIDILTNKNNLMSILERLYSKSENEYDYINQNTTRVSLNLPIIDGMLFNNKDNISKFHSNSTFSYYENLSFQLKSFKNTCNNKSPYTKANNRANNLIQLFKKNIKLPDYSLFSIINDKKYYSKLKIITQIESSSDSTQTQSEIKGPAYLVFSLSHSIKLGYSVIPAYNTINKKNKNNFEFNFSLHIENFIKLLNTQASIDTTESLNNLFNRYSIPLDLKYFLIPRIKLAKIADLIKIDLLTELIEKTLFLHEGLGFISKIYFININNNMKAHDIAMRENYNAMNDGYFPFIKEKNLFSIFKEKIYQCLLCLFSVHKAQPSFVTFFYEQINLFFFLKQMTLRLIASNILKSPLDDSLQDLFTKQYTEFFIKNLIITANDKPYLFLSMLEIKLQITIEPLIKYKASISKDQFFEIFTSNHILESELNVNSFISTKEVIEYLYTDISPLEEDFEAEFPKDDINENFNIMGPKINNKKLKNNNVNQQGRKLKSIKAKMIYRNRLKTHNTNQSFSKSEISDCIESRFENSANFNMNNDMVNHTIVSRKNTSDQNIVNGKNNIKQSIYNKILQTIDLPFNGCLFKLRTSLYFQDNFDFQGKASNKESFLKYRYSLGKVKLIKEWRNRIDYLINDVYSVIPIESTLISVLGILFVLSFFVEKEGSKGKDFLSSIKEIIKNKQTNSIYDLSMMKLFEGFISEKHNYVESEYYYSSSLVLMLYLYGDPRGKGNFGNAIMYFPLWKIARQTTILEDFHISEYFKELFHCQDYLYKTQSDVMTYITKLLEEDYSPNDKKIKGYNEYIENQSKYNIEDELKIKEYIKANSTFTQEDTYHTSFLNPLYDNSIRFLNKNSVVINFFEDANKDIKEKQPMTTTNHNRKISLRTQSINETEYENVDENVTDNKNHIYLNKDSDDDQRSYEEIQTNEKDNIFWLIEENYVVESSYQYNFPSISNLKKDNVHLLSNHSFIVPFLQWFIKFNMNKGYNNEISFYSEDYFVNKMDIGLFKQTDYNNMNPTLSSYKNILSNTNSFISNNHHSNIFDNLRENSILAKNNIFPNSFKKGNGKAILSQVLYDVLLKKLSYRVNPPKGFLLSFGYNKLNQTSHSNYDIIQYPRLCYKLKEEIIDKVSCGWEHTIALSRNKQVFSWGNNAYGQCAIPQVSNEKLPTNVIFNPTKIKNLTSIMSISTGNEFSIAVDAVGSAYAWGKNEGGVLGVVENKKETNGTEIEDFIIKPSVVQGIKNIKAISTGSLHCVGINNNLKVYSWGCGEGGQLGLSEDYLIKNSSTACISNPTEIIELRDLKVTKISSGEAHSVALTSLGDVFTWGLGVSGQLGLGFCTDSFEPGTGVSKSRRLTPERVILGNDKKESNKPYIIDVICGKTSTFFIDKSGGLYACGSNDLGQLGVKKESKTKEHLFDPADDFNICYDIVTPIKIEFFNKMKVKKLACGESHCLAIIEDINNQITSIWSWGHNKFGQLGQGNINEIYLPKPITYLHYFEGCRIVDVICGAYHSICLFSNFTQPKPNNISDIMDHFILCLQIWKSEFN